MLNVATQDQIEAAKQRVQAAVDEAFASVDQSSFLHTVAKPIVRFGDQWGRVVVEVELHWQLRAQMMPLIEAAGLGAKVTNYGVMTWDPATI